MRKSLTLMVLMGLMGCEEYPLGELLDINDYFIKLNAEPAAVAGLAASLTGSIAGDTEDEDNEAAGLRPTHIFDSSSEGFAIVMPQAFVEDFESLEQVAFVRRADEEDNLPPEEDPEEIEDPLPPPSSPPVPPSNPDEPVPIDPLEIPPSIVRIGGPYAGVPTVEVAVIDTGCDSFHPDLNIVAEYDAVFLGGGNQANGGDVNGHGTHVAGTIGAVANGEGVVGVVPGTPIHAVRVLSDEGSGKWTDIMAGVEYVLDNPQIRVVNMSLGGNGDPTNPSDPLRDSLQRLEDAGVIVVIAAGNSTEDTSGFVPAGYDIGVVVSAYDASAGDLGYAYFSNFGDAVDISAPGVEITSTWPGGGYADLQGTSMAAPAVAGVAAAYLNANPNGTPAGFRDLLRSGGETGLPGMGGNHPEPFVNGPAVWTP